MKSREVIEVPTKEKIKLVVLSGALISILASTALPPHDSKTPSEPSPSPLSTPEVKPTR